MKLFSVIIPVYNTEGYIDRCLSSVFNQGLDDSFFEIIVVNDGSTDGSMHIVYNYLLIHNNIYVIDQQNSGVSVARNNGLQMASGKWIIFLDSDDCLYTGSLSELLSLDIINQSWNVLICKSISNDNQSVNYYPWNHLGIKNHEFYSGIELYQKGFNRGSACGCVFNRDFLNSFHLRFPEQVVLGEDVVFISLVYIYSQAIIFHETPLYCVEIRSGSASRKFDFDRCYLYCQNFNFLKNYIIAHKNLSFEQLSILDYTKFRLINYAIYVCMNSSCFNPFKLKKILNLRDVLPIEHNPTRNGSYKVWLLNHCFSLYFYVVVLKYSIKDVF